MSIASEITLLTSNLKNAKAAVITKGGVVGETGLAGLAEEIASIPSGGGNNIDRADDFPTWTEGGQNEFYCKVWYHPCEVAWGVGEMSSQEVTVVDAEALNAFLNEQVPRDSRAMASQVGDGTYRLENGTIFTPQDKGLEFVEPEYPPFMIDFSKNTSYSGGPTDAKTTLLQENQLSCLAFSSSDSSNTLPNGDIIIPNAVEGVDLIYDNPVFPNNFCSYIKGLNRMIWRCQGTATFGEGFLSNLTATLLYPRKSGMYTLFLKVTTRSLPNFFWNNTNIQRLGVSSTYCEIGVSESIGDYVFTNAIGLTPSVLTYFLDNGGYVNHLITVGTRFGASAQFSYDFDINFIKALKSCGDDCYFPYSTASTINFENLTTIGTQSSHFITIVWNNSIATATPSVTAPVLTSGQIYFKKPDLVVGG